VVFHIVFCGCVGFVSVLRLYTICILLWFIVIGLFCGGRRVSRRLWG